MIWKEVTTEDILNDIDNAGTRLKDNEPLISPQHVLSSVHYAILRYFKNEQKTKKKAT